MNGHEHHRGRTGAPALGCARAVRTLALALLLVSCSRAPPNATPEGAVREFIEVMETFDGNEGDAEKLFDLLSERAKKNLRARAERYGAASGKKIAPSAMLVPKRVSLRFSPHSYSAQIVGKYALVDVLGVRGSQRAQVPCVFEEGAWRIDLVLPEPPPMRMRPSREN